MGGIGKGTSARLQEVVLDLHARDARHRKVLYLVGRLIKSAVRELLMDLLSVIVLTKVGSLSYLSSNKTLYILHMAVYMYVPVEAT
jgi:hypothetical protein